MLFILQALELLPPGIKIKDILVYLENVLELKSATKHRTQVLRNMLFSESLQVREIFFLIKNLYGNITTNFSMQSFDAFRPVKFSGYIPKGR